MLEDILHDETNGDFKDQFVHALLANICALQRVGWTTRVRFRDYTKTERKHVVFHMERLSTLTDVQDPPPAINFTQDDLIATTRMLCMQVYALPTNIRTATVAISSVLEINPEVQTAVNHPPSGRSRRRRRPSKPYERVSQPSPETVRSPGGASGSAESEDVQACVSCSCTSLSLTIL